MQDSILTFKFKATGIEEINAQADRLGVTLTSLTRNVNGTYGASGKLASTLNDQASATGRAGGATDKAAASQENYLVHIAKTTVLSALVNKAFLGLGTAAGAAVKQVDLFNNFPASMAALGLSSADASAGFQKLKSYVASVGGDLTKATTSVQRFVGVTHNVGSAVAEYAGINNALIAGGANADVQANALEQLTQAYSRGRPQLIEYKSLLVAMQPQLEQVAHALKLPNAAALGDQLTKGKTSMQDFITELTKLSTGVGPIAAQARARMSGIEFATNQLKNTLTNGLAAIYQAVGRENIVAFLQFTTQVIGVLAQGAVALINILITLFNFISRIFGGPQLSHFTGQAQGAADALGNGAANADDMANGLGNAADNAAKINKSLASFDKMNVLPDKTSGTAKNGADTGPGATSPAGTAALADILGGLGGKLAAVSTAAKVFAGILGGIAALKVGEALINQVDGITKAFKKIPGAVSGFKTSLIGGVDESGNKVDGLAQKIGKIPTVITGGFKDLGGFLTNPWVLLALAIAAVVAGIIYLYNTNKDFKKGFDSIWNPIVKTFKDVAKIIGTDIVGAFKLIGKAFSDATKPFKPQLDEVKKLFDDLIGKVKDVAKHIGLTGDAMKIIGKIVAVIGAAIALYFLAPFIAVAAAVVGIGIVLAAVGAAIVVAVLYVGKYIYEFIQGTIAFFKGLFDAIVAIFSAVTDFFINVFKGAWEGIKLAFSLIVAFFQLIWDAIVAAVKLLGQGLIDAFKLAWEGIKLAFSLIVAFFQLIWDTIVAAAKLLGKGLIDGFKLAWEGIKLAFSFAVGFFKDAWNGIKDAFGAVASFFGNVFSDAWNAIKTAFNAVGSFFRGIWNDITSIFGQIGTAVGDAIGSAFKSVINGVLSAAQTILNAPINTIDSLIGKINSIPGVPNIPKIPNITLPRLAKGGVVQSATTAVIGENGAEAIVPLQNNTEWIDTLASKLKSAQGIAGSPPIQLVVQIGEDHIVTKVIDLINEKTNMSGRNTILV